MKNYTIRKLENFLYEIEKNETMRVPVRIYADSMLFQAIKEDAALDQGYHVACSLPGIRKYVIMCPDAHQGYGFPIGGVAAFSADNGCITPGGIGFDINCGVRLLATNLMIDDLKNKIEDLLSRLFNNVPSGVGKASRLRLSDKEMDDVLSLGAKWALSKGWGTDEDMLLAEEEGCMRSARADKVSATARKRGRDQLGTLGSGNHFLEIQKVAEIYNADIARAFHIERPEQIMVSIHCGSRGLGHQVCSDYIQLMEEAYPKIRAELPDKDLIYAPIGSPQASDYYAAMSAAANFAWANRHIIAHWVRESFNSIWHGKVELQAVYDVAHNIAKLEQLPVDGKQEQLFVHRKGATRSFPAGHPAIPEIYRSVGQPVLIPGSMGTSSYILCGTTTALENSFGSTAHGAGRRLSRHQALKQFRGEKIRYELNQQQIFLKTASLKGIAEEAPLAYKDIERVINVTSQANLALPVARLIPVGVIKG